MAAAVCNDRRTHWPGSPAQLRGHNDSDVPPFPQTSLFPTLEPQPRHPGATVARLDTAPACHLAMPVRRRFFLLTMQMEAARLQPGTFG